MTTDPPHYEETATTGPVESSSATYETHNRANVVMVL